MDDQEKRFCVRCGAELPADSLFCPDCGSPVDGGENIYDVNRPRFATRPDTMGSTSTLVLIYGIFAAAFGLLMIVSWSAFTPELWQDFIQEFGDVGFTYDFMKEVMGVGGACLIVSGAAALLSAFLSNKREHWMIAVVSCAVASFAVFGFGGIIFGILLCIIGLLMTYRIYKNKDAFKS